VLAKLLGCSRFIENLRHREVHLRVLLEPRQQVLKRARLPGEVGVEHPDVGRKLSELGCQSVHGASVARVVWVGEEAISPGRQLIDGLTGLVGIHHHRVTHLRMQSL